MSIETEIAALTVATSGLLAEVNLSKEELDARIDAVLNEASSIGGATLYKTYTELLAVTGMTAGQAAMVFVDTGTHTDPVVGGTVPNTGIFRYSTSPVGWERISGLVNKEAEAAATLAENSALVISSTIKQVDYQTESWVVTNEDNLKIASITPDGSFSTKAITLNKNGITHSDWSSEYNMDDNVSALTITDLDGLVIASFDPSGSRVPGIASTSDIPTTRKIFDVANRANSIVCIGDSIVDQNSVARTLYDMNRKTDYGPLVWADFFLGGRLDFLHNAGIGGETTALIKARHYSEVITYAPGYNLVHCGINSITSTNPVYSVSSIITDLQEMYEANSAAGIVTIALTILPLYTGQANANNSVFAKICEVNAWIRSYARANRGIILADVFAKVIDPISELGIAKQYYLQTDDHIHPSVLGAKVMGECIADAIRSYVKPLEFLPASVVDRWSLVNSGKQLLDNPLFQGSSGTNTAGSTFNGVVPNGWRIGKSGTWGDGLVVGSLSANPDGYGNDWVITVLNSGAVGDTITLICDDVHNNKVTNGDSVFSACGFSATNLAKFMGMRFQVSTTGGAVTNIGSTMEYTAQQPTTGSPQNWTSDMYPQSNLGGVLVTGKAIVPSGTISGTRTSLTLRFDGLGATGQFRISRIGMWKE
jgi:lysophospholipase L1-like esterase